MLGLAVARASSQREPPRPQAEPPLRPSNAPERRAPLVVAALVAAALAWSTMAAHPADGQDVADAAAADPPAAEIQSLGNAGATLYLVDHDGAWSMHAENVSVDRLLELWAMAGGPQAASKAPLGRDFTLSVHRMSPERIVERMLDGYNYTLHYDGDGRLARVHIYDSRPGRIYKTPRLVERRSQWEAREDEFAATQGPHPASDTSTGAAVAPPEATP